MIGALIRVRNPCGCTEGLEKFAELMQMTAMKGVGKESLAALAGDTMFIMMPGKFPVPWVQELVAVMMESPLYISLKTTVAVVQERATEWPGLEFPLRPLTLTRSVLDEWLKDGSSVVSSVHDPATGRTRYAEVLRSVGQRDAAWQRAEAAGVVGRFAFVAFSEQDFIQLLFRDWRNWRETIETLEAMTPQRSGA